MIETIIHTIRRYEPAVKLEEVLVKETVFLLWIDRYYDLTGYYKMMVEGRFVLPLLPAVYE